MIKTNKEVELIQKENSKWLFSYADGSDFYIPNVLHIEKNDSLKLGDKYDDKQASRDAEKEGISLIYNMEGVPNGVYVDTEENRNIITEMLILYPEYKKLTNS